MSQLTSTIALLYRMETGDVKQLEAALLERRKTAWVSSLANQARAHNCNRTPNAPRREDLREIKRMCKADAKSISNTWNREVTREIERLYNANPKGNRQYYFANLERWNSARDQWKLPQISLTTEMTTREYAAQRFRQMNYETALRFLFDGPPTTCVDCTRRFAAGLVNENYVRRYPTPRHIGCPHTWRVVNVPQIDCAELWLG